jgi:hypothetical protein
MGAEGIGPLRLHGGGCCSSKEAARPPVVEPAVNIQLDANTPPLPLEKAPSLHRPSDRHALLEAAARGGSVRALKQLEAALKASTEREESQLLSSANLPPRESFIQDLESPPKLKIEELAASDLPPHFGPDALLASVESGAIAPLRGSWVVALHERDGRLKRRQDLPAEAFFSAAELRELVMQLGEDYGLLFVALSYRYAKLTLRPISPSLLPSLLPSLSPSLSLFHATHAPVCLASISGG